MQTRQNICFNQWGNISTLWGGPVKLVDKFTYLGISVSSIENDINTRLAKTWMSDLNNKIKQFFQAVVVLILFYGYPTWTLTERMEKKLDGNYTRMLWAVLNKSWRQHPTKQQLHGHLPPTTKTIQVWQTRHAGHYWKSKDEHISYILQWTPSNGRAKVRQPVRIYI